MKIIVYRKDLRVDVYRPRLGRPDSEGEVLEHWFRCALGMKGFRTPLGLWRLGTRSRTPDWQAPIWAAVFGMKPGQIYKFGQPGNPYRAGLINLVGVDRRTKGKTGYAMHGTSAPESIPGYGSHGCVRLHDKDLLWLYENCPAGTPVEIRR